MSKRDTLKNEVRSACEASLLTFIKVVHPQRELGKIHEDAISWMCREGAKSHQLLLLPRDHQKSAITAYRAAWEITKNPAIRILYVSSTTNLAEKQLGFIKDILTCDRYRYYWPEMVNKDVSKRKKWAVSEICVDHPLRAAEVIRDPTVFTAGLTTSITGLHCDIAILDDVVVDENAFSEQGRASVESQIGYMASILGTEGRLWAAGTRYHPKDYYGKMIEMVVKIYDEDGNISKSYPLYEVFEAQVESRGDGTGEYLWPRKQRSDGKWFGFNQTILAEKKAQYTDISKFKAQYYNQPNDLGTSTIQPDMFQYYEKSLLKNEYGNWYFKGKRLNVFAAIDFAYTVNKHSDFTAITVVGVDGHNNYYVLDIDRFQSNKISDYFDRILKSHTKWNFRKLIAETTAAQSVIVEDLKNNYVRPLGMAFTIEGKSPSRRQGAKEERIEAILQPKYANKQMWHYKGGNCELLEEELMLQNPPHDDIKDSLAACIDGCIAPSSVSDRKDLDKPRYNVNRFGWSANI